MLGKLLKYEVKSVSRTYLPIYVLVILMAVVNKILSVVSPSSFETPKVISAMGYGMVGCEDFLLVCEYGDLGADPRLILYKKR